MIDRDRWREVDAVLGEALDVPPEERAAFLASRCPDAAIRIRVEALLARADREDLLSPGAALDGTFGEEFLQSLESLQQGVSADENHVPGEQVDTFRLTRKLGEGGMGEVWEAEQVTPLRRRVALKLIKRGMDSRQVLARFESERQALALMNHRNVAQVFGGGAAESGRPYFAMEYVPGVPVTDYCREKRLSLRGRLELFIEICEGVQHAHYKGIVHRDLKPTNILVAEEDGRPVPKIIDFGVARALDTDAAGETTLTQHGQIIGTAGYMSPEQADPSARDIDTRADVYSLGILLYELLVGVGPFDAPDLESAGFLELLHRIREVDPERPSRRAEPSERRRIRGDLDWIVMKALEKERARRYDSPRVLADDVRRHLDLEPVIAGPPSRLYKLGKLVRRNRATVAVACVALIAVVAGTVVATTQAVRATRAEVAARREAETAGQVSDFLVDLFEVSSPEQAQGETVTARELLDRGAAGLEGDRSLAGQPLVRARLQETIGEIYRKMALFDSAAPLLENALETREEMLGPGDPEVVRTLQSLARVHKDRGDLVAAEEMFREALERLESVPEPDPVRNALLTLELADILRDTARFAEAEAGTRDAIGSLEREAGPTSEEVGRAYGSLGSVLHHAGRYAEAEQAFRTSLETLESVLGADHLGLVPSMNNLANTLSRLGRYDEAEPLFKRVVAATEQAYGAQHPAVASSLAGLGALYGRQGRNADAEATFERALAIREAVFGRDSSEASDVLKNIGLLQMLMGDYEPARQTLERTLAIDERVAGPEHPSTSWTRNRLGALYVRLARFDAAAEEYRSALAANEKVFGAGHVSTIGDLIGLGTVALEQGRFAQAEDRLSRATSIAEGDNPESPIVSQVRIAFAELRLKEGRFGEAEALLERVRTFQASALPPDHPAHGMTRVLQGEVLLAQGRPEDAEVRFEEGLAILDGAYDAGHPDAARALHGLGVALVQTGREQEARDTLGRALEIRRARLGAEHPDTLATSRALASIDVPR